MGTGDAHDVDVATIDARTRKTIVDGRQRQFRFGGDTGILLAREPFERDCREQFIVAKEARRSIVLAVVEAEEVHGKDLARSCASAAGSAAESGCQLDVAIHEVIRGVRHRFPEIHNQDANFSGTSLPRYFASVPPW